jgi:hypothetical protein
VPNRYGCIHLSEADMNLPAVIEASRPFGMVTEIPTVEPIHQTEPKRVAG